MFLNKTSMRCGLLVAFRLEGVNPHRQKVEFFSTMGATGPTTRPPLSLFKFRARPFNPTISCLRFFGRLNPADLLIARKRRNVFPYYSSLRGGSKRFPQIRRHFVNHSAIHLSFGHILVCLETFGTGVDKPKCELSRKILAKLFPKPI